MMHDLNFSESDDDEEEPYEIQAIADDSDDEQPAIAVASAAPAQQAQLPGAATQAVELAAPAATATASAPIPAAPPAVTTEPAAAAPAAAEVASAKVGTNLDGESAQPSAPAPAPAEGVSGRPRREQKPRTFFNPSARSVSQRQFKQLVAEGKATPNSLPSDFDAPAPRRQKKPGLLKIEHEARESTARLRFRRHGPATTWVCCDECGKWRAVRTDSLTPEQLADMAREERAENVALGGGAEPTGSVECVAGTTGGGAAEPAGGAEQVDRAEKACDEVHAGRAEELAALSRWVCSMNPVRLLRSPPARNTPR